MWWYNRWDYIISLFSVFFSVFFFVFVLFFGKFMLFFVVVVLFRLFPCYFGRLDAFCLYFYTTVCCVLTLYVQCLGSTLFVWAFFVFLGCFYDRYVYYYFCCVVFCVLFAVLFGPVSCVCHSFYYTTVVFLIVYTIPW